MSDDTLQSKIIKMHCKTIQEQHLKLALLERKLELCRAQRNEYVFKYEDLKDIDPLEVLENLEQDIEDLK